MKEYSWVQISFLVLRPDPQDQARSPKFKTIGQPMDGLPFFTWLVIVQISVMGTATTW